MKVAPYVPAVVAVTVQVHVAMLLVVEPTLAVADGPAVLQVLPLPPVPVSVHIHGLPVVPVEAPVPVLVVVNCVEFMTVMTKVPL